MTSLNGHYVTREEFDDTYHRALRNEKEIASIDARYRADIGTIKDLIANLSNHFSQQLKSFEDFLNERFVRKPRKKRKARK